MALRIARLFIFISLLPFTTAQSFSVPVSWRKPTSTLDRSDRLTLLNGLLHTLPGMVNGTTGLFDGLSNPQTANMLCALAIGDHITNSNSSQEIVVTSLSTKFSLDPDIIGSENPKVNSDPAIWGLAAIYAYEAYGDPTLLRHAQSMWTQLTDFFVTNKDATTGTLPSRNAKLQSTCNGAGAVFFIQDDPNNLSVNGETIAAFMTLSAHLYEQTSMRTYLSSAILSADFIINHLYDGNIIVDSIILDTCEISKLAVTYNSGFTFDGLSILASVGSGESAVDYKSFLSNLISTTVAFTKWTNATDGIIIEGPSNSTSALTNGFGMALKAIFIRGLYQAYTRLKPDSPEANFIRSFISVQFNALLDLASFPGSNQYSPQWEGPPATESLLWGQLSAIDVLTSAVGLVSPEMAPGRPGATNSGVGAPSLTIAPASAMSTSSSLSPSPGALADNHRRKVSGGAIVGIVIGLVGIAILAGAFAFVLMRRKRRQRRRTMERTARAYDSVVSEHMGKDIPTVQAPGTRKERIAQQIRYFGSVRRTHGSSSSGSGLPQSSIVEGTTLVGVGDEKGKKMGYTIEKESKDSNIASLSRLVDDLRRVVLPSDYNGTNSSKE